jgi:hypothetical protein
VGNLAFGFAAELVGDTKVVSSPRARAAFSFLVGGVTHRLLLPPEFLQAALAACGS